MGAIGAVAAGVGLTGLLGGKLLKGAKESFKPAALPQQPTAIEPPKELKAPTLDDAAPAAEEERKRGLKQQGRASTVLKQGSEAGSTAKTTLG